MNYYFSSPAATYEFTVVFGYSAATGRGEIRLDDTLMMLVETGRAGSPFTYSFEADLTLGDHELTIINTGPDGCYYWGCREELFLMSINVAPKGSTQNLLESLADSVANHMHVEADITDLAHLNAVHPHLEVDVTDLTHLLASHTPASHTHVGADVTDLGHPHIYATDGHIHKYLSGWGEGHNNSLALTGGVLGLSVIEPVAPRDIP